MKNKLLEIEGPPEPDEACGSPHANPRGARCTYNTLIFDQIIVNSMTHFLIMYNELSRTCCISSQHANSVIPYASVDVTMQPDRRVGWVGDDGGTPGTSAGLSPRVAPCQNLRGGP